MSRDNENNGQRTVRYPGFQTPATGNESWTTFEDEKKIPEGYVFWGWSTVQKDVKTYKAKAYSDGELNKVLSLYGLKANTSRSSADVPVAIDDTDITFFKPGDVIRVSNDEGSGYDKNENHFYAVWTRVANELEIEKEVVDADGKNVDPGDVDVTFTVRIIQTASEIENGLDSGSVIESNPNVTVTGSGTENGQPYVDVAVSYKSDTESKENTIGLLLPTGEYKIEEVNIPTDYELVSIDKATVTIEEDATSNPHVIITNLQRLSAPALGITKTVTSTKPDGGYKAGDEVTFEVTVKNIGNVALTNVVITDILEGVTVEKAVLTTENGEQNLTPSGDGKVTVGSFGLTDVVVLTVKYTVTNEDLEKGEITNTAKAKADNAPDEKEASATVNADDLANDTSSLTATKTITSGDGPYKLNDAVTFKIEVKNTGNTILYNVTVTEELNGAVIGEGEGYTVGTNGVATIAALLPGKSVTLTATYTVTQADVDNGSAANSVTVAADQIENPSKPDVEIPIEEGKTGLSVTKTVVKGENDPQVYKVGDEITYKITITNNGTATLNGDITIEESLKVKLAAEQGDNITLDATGKKITVTGVSLAPNGSVGVNVIHVVDEADIEAAQENGGKLTNTVTVKKGDDDEDPGVSGGDDVEVAVPGLTVTKAEDTAKRPESGEYSEGDTITWNITVQNTGNCDLAGPFTIEEDSDVSVSDTVSVKRNADNSAAGATVTASPTDDNKIQVGDDKFVLAAGESFTVVVTYTVTAEDIEQGEVTNTVKVIAPNPNKSGETLKPETGTGTVDNTQKPERSLKVTKTIDGDSSTIYQTGDAITYKITVENTGNVAITGDITIEESLKVTLPAGANDGQNVELSADGKTIIVKDVTLAANESVVVTVAHTVDEADIGAAKTDPDHRIFNSVTVKAGGDGLTGEGTDESGAQLLVVPEVPTTGDDSHIGMWFVMACMALTGLLGCALIMKKQGRVTDQ